MNYKNQPFRRRTVLKTVSSGLVVSGLVSPVSAGGDDLSQELSGVRKATQKYKDVQTARDDGYEEFGPYVENMGFHFARLENGVPRGIERKNPPILLYRTTGDYDRSEGEPHDDDRDNDLRLVATEYAIDGEDDVYPNIFSDEDADRHLKTTEEEGWQCTPPVEGHALHVWVHRNNPDGVFAPYNPTID